MDNHIIETKKKTESGLQGLEVISSIQYQPTTGRLAIQVSKAMKVEDSETNQKSVLYGQEFSGVTNIGLTDLDVNSKELESLYSLIKKVYEAAKKDGGDSNNITISAKDL